MEVTGFWILHKWALFCCISLHTASLFVIGIAFWGDSQTKMWICIPPACLITAVTAWLNFTTRELDSYFKRSRHTVASIVTNCLAQYGKSQTPVLWLDKSPEQVKRFKSDINEPEVAPEYCPFSLSRPYLHLLVSYLLYLCNSISDAI